MAKAKDLSCVSPAEAARLLRRREAKKREYARKREAILARNAAWRAANPEKEAVCIANWRTSNPERCAENKRRWYEQNRALQIERARHRAVRLVDSVVKVRYCHGTDLQSKDIPPELVPAIRLSILIKRQIWEQRRELRRTDR